MDRAADRGVLYAVMATCAVALAAFLPSGEAAERDGRDYAVVHAKRRTTDKTWRECKTRTLAHVAGYRPPAKPVARSPYGGRADRKAKATGFFRAERIDRRWWLVDPAGYLWYSVGCCSVRQNATARGVAARKKLFGTSRDWARATNRMLWDLGYNTLGCWSRWGEFQDHRPRLPYTTQSNFMSSYGKKRGGTYQKPGHTGYPGDCIFVFDPEFETFCAAHAKRLLAATRDDRYLLGHFSDNEMPLRHDALDRYLKLPETDPGRMAAEAWVRTHRVRRGPKGYPAEARRAFLTMLVERYLRIVSRAIRKADPNHLYLGCRFHGRDLREPAVWAACEKYVDVISVNYYGAWTPDAERMTNWAKWSRRPFVVTEWYAKGMDSRMSNISGAGWTVKTQADRGRFYQNFTLALLAHRACVGWHWFKYIDNDPTNRRADPSNRDSNKGIVSNTYEPYRDLAVRMQALNRRVYSLIDHFDRRR